jgi:hypothetical protein
MGDETAQGEGRTFEELDRCRDAEAPLAIEEKLGQRDRIETQASRPKRQLVGQIGEIPREGRPRTHQVPDRCLDCRAVVHRVQSISGQRTLAS